MTIVTILQVKTEPTKKKKKKMPLAQIMFNFDYIEWLYIYYAFYSFQITIYYSFERLRDFNCHIDEAA